MQIPHKERDVCLISQEEAVPREQLEGTQVPHVHPGIHHTNGVSMSRNEDQGPKCLKILMRFPYLTIWGLLLKGNCYLKPQQTLPKFGQFLVGPSLYNRMSISVSLTEIMASQPRWAAVKIFELENEESDLYSARGSCYCLGLGEMT